MPRTLIIGYGNTLRGDDAIGWRAAEQLAASQPGVGVQIQTHHQLTPELAEPISQADLVIFLDADCQGAPGRVRCQSLEPAGGRSGLTHHVNPGVLLAMAQQLFGHCPRAFVISVAGASFECGETLSPAVQRALPAVRKLLARLLAGTVLRWVF